MEEGSFAIPLARLRGFRMANGALDMRLWHVHSADGRRIGMVDELLVDPATLEVRFLDVEVENLLATGRERHVLIPLCHARPDDELSHTVVVDGLSARAVSGLPAYAPGALVGGADMEFAGPFNKPAHPSRPAGLVFPVRVEPVARTADAAKEPEPPISPRAA